MNFTDEQLCGFIDNELTETQMEAVRIALIEDESLNDRIADLMMVDTLVKSTYQRIDNHPLNKDVFQNSKTESLNKNVIPFPMRRLLNTAASAPMKVAASLVLVIGANVLFFQAQSPTDHWSDISVALESHHSGKQIQISPELSIRTQLSFMNQSGDFCRLFQTQENKLSNNHIACRQSGSWKNIYSEFNSGSVNTTNYQTASQSGSAKKKVDEIIKGDFISESDEQQLINNHWSK